MSNIDDQAMIDALPLSPVNEANGVIYVSGHVPVGPDRAYVGGDVGAQTRQVLENIKRSLEAVGSSLDDVVKVTVFLVEAKRDFAAMNEAYREYFPGVKPARSTIGVDLAVDVLVEIEAVAVRGGADRNG